MRSHHAPVLDLDLTADWLGLNVGAGPFRAEGWLNVDVVSLPEIDPPIVPDLVGSIVDGLDLPDGSFDRVYLGHVLEHLDWDRAVRPALVEALRLLRPGGVLAVVGPDVLKSLRMYRDHNPVVSEEVMIAVLEGDVAGWDAGQWEGARHSWNCSAARVASALRVTGFADVEEVELDDARLDAFPLVSRVTWQCAVLATAP